MRIISSANTAPEWQEEQVREYRKIYFIILLCFCSSKINEKNYTIQEDMYSFYFEISKSSGEDCATTGKLEITDRGTALDFVLFCLS